MIHVCLLDRHREAEGLHKQIPPEWICIKNYKNGITVVGGEWAMLKEESFVLFIFLVSFGPNNAGSGQQRIEVIRRCTWIIMSSHVLTKKCVLVVVFFLCSHIFSVMFIVSFAVFSSFKGFFCTFDFWWFTWLLPQGQWYTSFPHLTVKDLIALKRFSIRSTFILTSILTWTPNWQILDKRLDWLSQF